MANLNNLAAEIRSLTPALRLRFASDLIERAKQGVRARQFLSIAKSIVGSVDGETFVRIDYADE